MELGVVKNGGKDFLGQDMLDEHFVDIGQFNIFVNDVFAQVKKRISGDNKGLICLCLLVDHVAEIVEDLRQVGLELLYSIAEIPDLCSCVGDKVC